METAGKIFTLLGILFLLMGLVFNLMPNLPRIPGDIYIDRPGLKIHVPITSSVVLSVIVTLFFNFFRK